MLAEYTFRQRASIHKAQLIALQEKRKRKREAAKEKNIADENKSGKSNDSSENEANSIKAIKLGPGYFIRQAQAAANKTIHVKSDSPVDSS